MTVISQMTMKLHPGRGDEGVAAFRARRVFEECAGAVPGFRGGELLVAQDCPDTLSVIGWWDDRQSFIDWTQHPVRDAQTRDLGDFLAETPVVRLFDKRG